MVVLKEGRVEVCLDTPRLAAQRVPAGEEAAEAEAEADGQAIGI